MSDLARQDHLTHSAQPGVHPRRSPSFRALFTPTSLPVQTPFTI